MISLKIVKQILFRRVHSSLTYFNYDYNLIDCLSESKKYIEANSIGYNNVNSENLVRNVLEYKKLINESFNDYNHLLCYGYYLLNNGYRLESQYEDLLKSSRICPDGVAGSKKILNNYQDHYFELDKNRKIYKKEAKELIKYCIAQKYNQKVIIQDMIDMLSEVIIVIDKNESMCFEIINRKLSSISNSRMTLTNLIISIVAIIIAVLVAA